MNDVNHVGEQPGHSSTGNLDRHAKPKSSHTQFLPTLLIGLAFLGWTLFKTVELAKDHQVLIAVQAAQRPQLRSSQKLRDALNGLAVNIKRLADKGDPGAQTIVKELGTHGITIHPQPRNNGIQN